MDSIAALIIGLLIGLYASRLRQRPKPAPAPSKLVTASAPLPAPAPIAPPEPEPPEIPPVPVATASADLSSRLKPLREAMDRFGRSASHPKELRNLDEFNTAVRLLADPSVSTAALMEYACGNQWGLGCAALAAIGGRADETDLAKRLLARMPEIGGWKLFFALDYFANAAARPTVGAVVARPGASWDTDALDRSLLADYFRRREELNDAVEFGDSLAGIRPEDLDSVESLLAVVEHPSAKLLLEQVRRWRANALDRDFLKTVGKFWTSEEDDLLIEHEGIRELVLTCESAVTASPSRSVLIVGEARTGKTAVARLAAKKLGASGYAVFEASAAELMAGQIYIGELEGRIRRVLAELSIDKRVVWVVPNLLQLANSGTHRGQSASLLDQILPTILSGRVVIISECSSNALTLLQQRWPILRTGLEVLRVLPAAREAIGPLAQEFVQRLGARQSLSIDPNVVALAVQLAGQYLSALQLPGAVLDLLKLSSNWAVAAGGDCLSCESVFGALSQATGLPRAILDDNERVELATVRKYFEARVIGQSEAVAAVVDRIAMLKAGLTDPGRPVAVFLFAGPTGTGKTELAKTLAEYLFGSPDRMLRLDMSEFQAYESTRKIIGAAGDETEAESLIQRVRKQPFAVVLLDEFEKAHQAVWDLFLQVFDDGRLTDAVGQTADFRQTFIVMTSNIGATAHEGSGVGFVARNDSFASQQIMRAVARSFRPEFVNRLDKVIVFQPLNRDHMRAILHKELRRVLQRRGLRNREWAVEWESSALDFLLDRGFNTQMGARPLKRAIEQYVVAPLASNIVEHRFPSGEQFLFVRGTQDGIEVEFVDPDGKDDALIAEVPDSDLGGPEGSTEAVLARIALSPSGNPAERTRLHAALESITAKLGDTAWMSLREHLLARMADPQFWQQPDRARIHSHFALIDRVEAAVRTAQSLNDRYDRGSSRRQNRFSQDLAARLSLQLLLVSLGAADALRGPPREVLMAIEATFDGGADRGSLAQWAVDMRGMYVAWAKARRMHMRDIVLSNITVMAFQGFGAEALLRHEAGLHLLESEVGLPGPPSRATVRVSLTSGELGEFDEQPGEEWAAKSFSGASRAAAVVRRYRFGSAPLVRDAILNWRSGKVHEVMAGNFDLLGLGAGATNE
jgi:ATP-dependent Clp protease ATP-binding subunit ClpC